MISYRELRILLYWAQTVLGLLFLALAYNLLVTADTVPEPLCNVVPGIILLGVGLGCTLFGLDTFLLKDDPDLWR